MLPYFCPMKNRKLKNSELNRKSVPEVKQAKKTPLILILDNIRSLNNVGSIFRTADAFLIERIFFVVTKIDGKKGNRANKLN